MVDQFHVLPLPAYNLQFNLVHPTQYHPTLNDAVVSIHFTLKHWSFNCTDTNIADIINMHVLVPPKDPLTPHQIKLALTDPFNSKLKKSPTKKTHVETK